MMDNLSDNFRGTGRKAYFIIAFPIIILIVFILLWAVLGRSEASHLMPVLPEPTVFLYQDDSSQVTVSFSELNDDPISYLNRTIVVSGNFLPVDRHDCLKYSGPDVQWSLTAENLQLDVRGFEHILHLIPLDTSMTVEGIWRLYQGPLGCGKGPPDGSLWYLDVKKILQPNPLVGKNGQVIPIIIGNSDPGLPNLVPTLVVDEVVPAATDDLISATSTSTEVIPPTIEGGVPLTETPTPLGGIPPTVTIQTTITPDILTATSIPGGTATAITVTAVSTTDPTIPTATVTPEQPPGLATSTKVPGGGYPGPVETSTPVPTINPYP